MAIMQILFHVSFSFETRALTSYFRQTVRRPVMKWSTLSPLGSHHDAEQQQQQQRRLPPLPVTETLY